MFKNSLNVIDKEFPALISRKGNNNEKNNNVILWLRISIGFHFSEIIITFKTSSKEMEKL